VAAANPVKRALTIAGSDPSGGAGIQADLKTFSQLRVYGMAVIAAMTAQNTLGVSVVEEVRPDFVAKQLESICSDIPPDAVKTGMLGTATVIETVARIAREYQLDNLVVDPVLTATSGAPLASPDAAVAFRRALIPAALVVTPNIDEAAVLTGTTVRTIQDMESASRRIHDMGSRYVLMKGGHLTGEEAVDLLFDGRSFSYLRSTRLAAQHTHGTGCVLSAAITAYLALGRPIAEAVALGKEFVTEALINAIPMGQGRGPCDPLGLQKTPKEI
jgi:hydroxymethylpyrimidine/phosphomethylpyrimidine kinase